MKDNNVTHQIMTIHPFDPRGMKVGGIETHVRQTIKFFPDDINLIVIGVDETNELELGKMIELRNEFGKTYQFLPILNTSKVHINKPAKKIFESLTLNFFMALFKYGTVIKALSKSLETTLESQRYEFSWFCRLYGLKYVQLTHGDSDPKQKLDSLLMSKLRFVHNFNEANAIKAAHSIISVSSEQAARLKMDFPARANDIQYMTVSVDDSLFKPTPYIVDSGVLKIAFAGRLDEQKRPSMMFKVVAKLVEKLSGKVEFHYIGVSKPETFPEYQAIKDHVICHGFQRSPDIAELWKKFHMGMVTSHFEGWPVYVMEAICSGRPVVSLQLEQMANTFEGQHCGVMLEHNNTEDSTVELMSETMLGQWNAIQSGKISAEDVNRVINPFKASYQLARLFELHKGS